MFKPGPPPIVQPDPLPPGAASTVPELRRTAPEFAVRLARADAVLAAIDDFRAMDHAMDDHRARS